MKVISGAQIGAGIAGLRAAKACEIETGGWIPKGGKTKAGPLSQEWIDFYGLDETTSQSYPERTRRNVMASQGTIRFAHDWYSAGERLTQRLLIEHKRPRWDIELRRFQGEWCTAVGPDEIPESMFAGLTSDWLVNEGIETVNIAGNGDVSIEPFVERFLIQVFNGWKERVRN